MNKLENLSIHSDEDLLLHLPLRYEDQTRVIDIASALRLYDEKVNVEGTIINNEIQIIKRRQLLITIEDGTETLILRFLHFYPSQIKQLSIGKRIRVYGEIRNGFSGAEMVHPTYQIVTQSTPIPETLTPIYPTCAGISQNFLRKQISRAVDTIKLEDTLPIEITETFHICPFEYAIRTLHHPPANTFSEELINRTHPAWRRIKFDELLAQQLSMRRAQIARRKQSSCALSISGNYTKQFLNTLPFTLTNAQQKVLREITEDLNKNFPMRRLLQGDVGSGKTVVAAISALRAIDNNWQAAIMAPTEILAEQHYERMTQWFSSVELSIVWISGSMKKKEKAQALEKIANGSAQLIIGTHALIQQSVVFSKLGLVIIDEQHRFGVEQRLSLTNKGQTQSIIPHQLMMSATPIPRTLAMTFYADLDVSVIDELPPGRKPIITRLINVQRRNEVIERVRIACASSRQVYWVCPLIEESETLQLQTAIDTYNLLVNSLPELTIGLVHGKMKATDKQQIMSAFQNGQIQILVATTVIEVGVDVANASLMIIEHAERFGLAQLHQLRGRIGRGAIDSICLLLYQSPLGSVARERLQTMRTTSDGFVIAQKDLSIRGPGEFLGARQSGLAVLRFADIDQDQAIVEQAAQLAQQLLQSNTEQAKTIIEKHLKRWLSHREDFLNA